MQKRKGGKKKKTTQKTIWSGFFEGDSLLAVSLPSLSVRDDRSAGVIRLTWQAIILPVFCSGKAFLNMHALHFPTTFPIQMDVPLLSPPFSCRLLCHPARRRRSPRLRFLFVADPISRFDPSLPSYRHTVKAAGRRTDRHKRQRQTSWQGCLSCAH